MSEHFPWDELTKTDRDDLQEENRREAEKFRVTLEALADLLEQVREATGPLIVRAFRCAKLNSSTVGAVATSQHMKGEAADIRRPGEYSRDQVKDLWQNIHCLLKHKGIPFGQLILESKERENGTWSHWCHFSLGSGYRDPARCGEVMTMEWPWAEVKPQYVMIERLTGNPGGY